MKDLLLEVIERMFIFILLKWGMWVEMFEYFLVNRRVVGIMFKD